MAACSGSNSVRGASRASKDDHWPSGLEAVVDVVVSDLAAVDDESQRWLTLSDGRRYAGQPGRLITPGISWDQEHLGMVRFKGGGMGCRRPSWENDGAFRGHADERKARSGGFPGLAHYPHDARISTAIDNRSPPSIQRGDDVPYRLGHGREMSWRHAARPSNQH
jgi:hypothetical protein